MVTGVVNALMCELIVCVCTLTFNTIILLHLVGKYKSKIELFGCSGKILGFTSE